MSSRDGSGFDVLANLMLLCPFFLFMSTYFIWLFRRRRPDSARKQRSRLRKQMRAGFSASTFSIGLALLHLEALARPGVGHEIVQMVEEDADEDGQGYPEHPDALLHRQLRRIRRGEPVERLTVRARSWPRSRKQGR